jgi:guanylate kinase
LRKKHPHINKTVSATTRAKRRTEVDGVDYYYISKDEFYHHQANGDFVEYELYDGEYYGTLFSEIDKQPVDEPLILVVDVRGRRNVVMRYPMAKSIFINPPSFEVLERRIQGRNENSPEEIKHRLKAAKEELEEASLYTYQVTNNDVDSCVEAIYKMITEVYEG